MDPQLTPQLVLAAYAQGIFPMAEHRRGAVQWVSPDPRAILPLNRFRVRRSLAKRVRQRPFRITRDAAFHDVIRACAETREERPETWINDQIIDTFDQLHEHGYAHSVEAFEDDRVIGGLYGVACGGAFFGESMFSRRTDASKICLVHLVEHMRNRGYVLLDVQFNNPHLQQFGVEEISRDAYLRRLHEALRLPVTWEGSD